MTALIMSVRERFDTKWMLCEETGCWVWTASMVNESGYGCFSGGGGTRRAHRVAWMLYRGPIPEGMFIDHVCRVRSCVNPDHLRVVTPRINSIENSLSHPATNARKTHCPKGHPLTTENLRYRTDGCRSCNICRRAYVKEYEKGRPVGRSHSKAPPAAPETTR